ncbi:MAG: leucine-rich repeat protein [Paludibacteraceae bacterium]|nr:leucine-rich repeat protein [Paludibacteraceae bacterium]
MKTKLFTLFLALTASVGTMFSSIKIGDLYYELKNPTGNKYEYAVVTYKSKTEKKDYATGDKYTVYNEGWNITSANIPSSISVDGEKYPVKSISDYAFCGCESLKSVKIPDNNVTHIGARAFRHCYNLTSVVIGDCVTNIEERAFEECPQISSLTIGKSVIYIGVCAFSGSSTPDTLYWNAIDYPSAKNGQSIYYNFSAKKCLYIGNEVERIPSQCFSSSKISTVTIPKSITFIGYRAFAYCSQLTTVYVGNPSPIGMGTKDGLGGSEVFDEASSSLKIYVPCGSVNAYKKEWTEYASLIQEPEAAAKSVSADKNKGSVTEIKSICTTKTTATANYGYHFTQWSDGNTDNPRTIDPTEDVTYTAEFAPNQYTITLECDAEQGKVEGAGTFDYLTNINISATPNEGYHFVKWSDNDESATRTIKVEKDLSLTAQFEADLNALNDVNAGNTVFRKKLIDGQLFILRGDKTYTVQGQEVR